MNSLVSSSITHLIQLLQAREISARELTQLYLRQIEVVNPHINAVVTLCSEQALARATLADQARDRGESWGRLHGIPFTVKDAFDTAGVLSTGGTQGRSHTIPKSNATTVDRLLAAGAILLGKTNTPELTLYYDTDNLLYGRTLNPYDLSRSPGGSSGGAAAIIAAGGSPIDIGSDTGGSIRLPAHFCGIAGIKPTAGLIPRTGLILPEGTPADSLTQVGPMARYAEDLDLLLPILAGIDWQDPATIPMPLRASDQVDPGLLKLAFYTDNGVISVSPDVDKVVREAARLIADLGAEVTEDRPAILEKTRELFCYPFNTDGGAWIRRLLRQVGTEELYPFLNWTDPANNQPEQKASDFTCGLEQLAIFRHHMLAFMRNYDVILAPVHSHAALPAQVLTSTEYRPAFSYVQPYNLTGWPSVVVRAGTSSEGLPIGLQVIAAPWREDIALAIAKQLEKRLGGWQPPQFLNHGILL